MKKKGYNYRFISYNDFQYNSRNKNKTKSIVIMFVILIIIILLIMTINIQSNIQSSEDSASIAIMQSQLEEEKQLKEQERIRKEEEERRAKLPVLTEVGKQNMENIYHSEIKRVFLTFDDGPSNNTHQILDTLKNENVKATFFMLGRNVEIFPETTKRVYNEGHYIANHGYTHEYSSIYSSPQAVLDEYVRCNNAVKNALGEPEYNSHLFRFPGGLPGGKYASIKQEAKQLLTDNNILSIDWNSLTGDAETSHPEQEKLMQKLKDTSDGKNNLVILMHDAEAKKVTADMLPDIITYLREQGYEFKSFYDIIK